MYKNNFSTTLNHGNALKRVEMQKKKIYLPLWPISAKREWRSATLPQHVTRMIPRSVHAKFHADWTKTVGARGIQTNRQSYFNYIDLFSFVGTTPLVKHSFITKLRDAASVTTELWRQVWRHKRTLDHVCTQCLSVSINFRLFAKIIFYRHRLGDCGISKHYLSVCLFVLVSMCVSVWVCVLLLWLISRLS